MVKLLATTYIYIIFLAVLYLLMLLYVKVATRYNIVDRPNNRSAHLENTITGGGLIFPISLLLCGLYFGISYPMFFIGLLVISVISFLDDLFILNIYFRMFFQFIAAGLLLIALNLSSPFPIYWLVFLLFFIVATINAYNFMDGINGITGSYSLLVLLTLGYINIYVVNFTATPYLIVITLAVLVFNFFNFRITPKCFAGDVGSMSIAFILIFFVGQLMLITNNVNYILLLLLYGIDTFTTIIFRLFRKEDIMEPHQTHFYQYLANEIQWPQLLVSCIYVGIQLIINLVFIFLIQNSLWLGISFALIMTLLFIAIRFRTEGSKKLLST